MSKVLLVFFWFCLVFLIIGTALFPQSAAFWLATGTGEYQILRLLLAGLLGVQLLTRPPRNKWLRSLSLAVALTVAGWAVKATVYNQMMALDSLSLLGAAVSMGVTALELPRHRVIHIPVVQL